MFGHGDVANLRNAVGIDLGYLADEVVALQALDASEDYQAAVAIYQGLDGALAAVERAEGFIPVCRKLAEARFLMARCRSRAERAPHPVTGTPCFFDPGHGPADHFVAWTPDGKAPRTVPACAVDARLVEAGDQPEPRLVARGRRMTPFWAAPDDYAYWFQGYFGSGDDCVPAHMLDGFPLGERFAEGAAPGEVITAAEVFAPRPG